MLKRITLLIGCSIAVFGQSEPYRPLFHFSPANNWTNDPNGLLYAYGEYHLFFQYNPFGNLWGHMSWGHAVSKDLTHWEQLPVALPEEKDGMIFSGSTVLDSQNSSGFGKNGTGPIVAMYTKHREGLQNQNIAYSNDHGRTWTNYAANPVIDIHRAEFRDPMVFWYEPSKKWIVAVSLAKEYKIRFYSSPDLKNWSQLGEFGPAGVKNPPNWECPSLFELPVANAVGQRKWVLMLGVADGAVAGGSGTQYFVGTFDGTTFVNDNSPDTVLWVDYGTDFYAAQTFSNLPKSAGPGVILAWMNNWKYAAHVPTKPWRGQMTYPRNLQLRKTAAGMRLFQTPVEEIKALRGEHVEYRRSALAKVNEALKAHDWPETLDMAAELEVSGSQDVGFELRKGAEHSTRIGYDAGKGVVYIDRTHSGSAVVDPAFTARRQEAPVSLHNGKLQLRVLLDRCSVEVFAQDGQIALTDLIFPDATDRKMELYESGGKSSVVSINIWKLQ
jgi:fructan beta-fructosidase